MEQGIKKLTNSVAFKLFNYLLVPAIIQICPDLVKCIVSSNIFDRRTIERTVTTVLQELPANERTNAQPQLLEQVAILAPRNKRPTILRIMQNDGCNIAYEGEDIEMILGKIGKAHHTRADSTHLLAILNEWLGTTSFPDKAICIAAKDGNAEKVGAWLHTNPNVPLYMIQMVLLCSSFYGYDKCAHLLVNYLTGSENLIDLLLLPFFIAVDRGNRAYAELLLENFPIDEQRTVVLTTALTSSIFEI